MPAMKRACITGGAGFIGSNLADRLVADGVEVVGRRRLPHRATRVPRATCSTDPGVTLVEGDVLDRRLLAHARCEGLRLGLPPPGERRRAPRPGAPDARPRAEHDRHRRRCSRRCEPCGRPKIAFSSTGSVYGEPEVFPTPEDAPFPAPDLAVRGVEAGRRGDDRRLQPLASASPGDLPLRLDPRRALHPRPRLRLLPCARARPHRPRVLGDGRQEKSYLYVEDCVDGDPDRRTCAHDGDPASSASTTWAPTRPSSSTTRSR